MLYIGELLRRVFLRVRGHLPRIGQRGIGWILLAVGLAMTGGTIFASDAAPKLLFFAGLILVTVLTEFWGRHRERARPQAKAKSVGKPRVTEFDAHDVPDEPPAPDLAQAAPGSEAERLHLAERPKLGETLRDELEKGLAIIKRIPQSDPRGTARAEAVAKGHAAPPDQQEFDAWRAGVESYLSVPGYAEFLAKFKEAMAGAADFVAQGADTDEAVRLRLGMQAKLDALAGIVQTLMPQSGAPASGSVRGTPVISTSIGPKTVVARVNDTSAATPTLVDLLRTEVDKGQKIFNALPQDPWGLAAAEAIMSNKPPPPGESEINAWRDRVGSLLIDYPEKRRRFSTMPPGPVLQLAAIALLGDDEEKRRRELSHQLKVLREIVEELDPPSTPSRR